MPVRKRSKASKILQGALQGGLGALQLSAINQLMQPEEQVLDIDATSFDPMADEVQAGLNLPPVEMGPTPPAQGMFPPGTESPGMFPPQQVQGAIQQFGPGIMQGPLGQMLQQLLGR